MMEVTINSHIKGIQGICLQWRHQAAIADMEAEILPQK